MTMSDIKCPASSRSPRVVDEIKNEWFPPPSFEAGRIVGCTGGYKVRITAGCYPDGDTRSAAFRTVGRGT